MGPAFGYADLLRIHCEDPTLAATAAELMGWKKRVVSESDDQAVPLGGSDVSSEPQADADGSVQDTSGWPRMAAPAWFLVPLQFRSIGREPEQRPDPNAVSEELWNDANLPGPQVVPIALWPEIEPRLRQALTIGRFGTRIAIDQVVQRVARGETIVRLPKEAVRKWGSRVQLVIDKSRHLIPYLDDQGHFRREIEMIFGQSSVEVGVFDESNHRIIPEAGRRDGFTFVGDGVPAIILSDFGALLGDQNDRLAYWHSVLGQIRSRACVVGVVPCDPRRIDQAIRSAMTIIPWQPPGRVSPADELGERQAQVRRMLAALACTCVVEPGLLRAVRSEVFGFSDASLEAEFWLSPELSSRQVTGAVIDTNAADVLLDQFLELDERQQRKALQIVRMWREKRSDEVWVSEVWRMPDDAKKHVPERDRRIAEERIRVLSAELAVGDGQVSPGCRAWLARVTKRVPDRVLPGSKALRELRRLARPKEKGVWLPGSAPVELKAGTLRRLHVRQSGSAIVASEAASAYPPLVTLRSTNGWVKCTPKSDCDAFWASGQPPGWATDWGVDDYGPWVEFRVLHEGAREYVAQRMRWVSPGAFLMGSRHSEAIGAFGLGTLHDVELTTGFWLFDTPVTQRLWGAVMGTNPSKIVGDANPVESVSWTDAGEFLEKLSALLNTQFALPTEAQWEYACRAGTETEFAFGDVLTGRQAQVASRNGSAPVKQFDPNRWGVYDMHGNVWEWCADWIGELTSAEQVDPVGPPEGLYRVLRGGSWLDPARYARSAYRNGLLPGSRYDNVGFRCAQVQTGAEPREEEDSCLAERRLRTTSDARAIAKCVNNATPQRFELPGASRVVLETDLETIELVRTPKPRWATAMGRDGYGVWAEFEIGIPRTGTGLQAFDERIRELFEGSPPERIVQRMRWIPPGTFDMGSSGPESSDIERPVHAVTLTHGYWLFDTQVTQELWLAVTGTTPSRYSGAGRPVETVSWDDCREFCEKLNESIEGLAVCLPTEAEWEYACRAGTTTEYGFGKNLNHKQARFGQSGGTERVASYEPNGWGLYDMHGNVWEWCADWRGPYAAEACINPTGAGRGQSRVLRGGSWSNPAQCARSAFRFGYLPGIRNNLVGFRCAQVHASGREASEQREVRVEGRDRPTAASE